MRRLHVPRLSSGLMPLDSAQAHHARDVLRLRDGQSVQAFDDSGATADAILQVQGPDLFLRIDQVIAPPTAAVSLTIASALPKAARADWMVEKLSELGVDRFIPLMTARSVVHPQGQKVDRWARLAIEAAKQSRRTGVLHIEPLTELAAALDQAGRPAWVLSTAGNALPLPQAWQTHQPTGALTLFIGPEGGWTEQELGTFADRALTAVSLGTTILRIETAAMAAAALVGVLSQSGKGS